MSECLTDGEASDRACETFIVKPAPCLKQLYLLLKEQSWNFDVIVDALNTYSLHPSTGVEVIPIRLFDNVTFIEFKAPKGLEVNL